MQLQAVSSLLPPGQLFPRQPQRLPSQVTLPVPVNPPVTTTPPAEDAPDTPASEPVEAPPGDSILGDDRFLRISKYAAQGAGGAFAAYRLGKSTGELYREISKAFQKGGRGLPQAKPGIEGALMNGVKGAGMGALVSAGISLVSNGWQVTQGEITTEDLTDRVVDDTLNGAFAGFGGVTLGGLGNLVMGSMGMTGLPLTIGTAAVGAVGGILLSQFSQPFEETE